ncbi:MAG: DinB family protein, partial [Actinomycetota bacterium]|nr:DinB family protein [Actinomycetota bacterium]
MGWRETRDAAVAEGTAIVELAEALETDDWGRPALGDWSTGGLVSHVANAMGAQQQAFQHMLAGSDVTPPYENRVFDGIAPTMALLRSSHDALLATQPRLTEAHVEAVVPLPFGSFPTPLALQIILLEYGTHRWDLAAVGDPDAALSDETSACVLELLPAFLLMYATAPPTDPLAFRLEAGETIVEVRSGDGGWELAPSAPGDTLT